MFVFTSILISLVFWYLLNAAYKRTNHYTQRFGQIRKFKHVPEGINLANFGSNHSLYGFNYDGLRVTAFNFALGPQSLFYDYEILKRYERRLNPDCVVLISVPPCVFMLDELDYSNDGYYSFLGPSQIPQFSWVKKLVTDTFPLLSSLRSVRYLLKDIREKPLPKNSEARCREDAVKRRDGWIRQFGLQDMLSDAIPAEIVREFDKTTVIVSEMVDFCLERGFRPVFVIPPVSKALEELLGTAFLKVALYNNIKRANVRNIPVLDYFGDKQFLDYSLYINSDFLNEYASRGFTRRVLKDLLSLGYLPAIPSLFPK